MDNSAILSEGYTHNGSHDFLGKQGYPPRLNLLSFSQKAEIYINFKKRIGTGLSRRMSGNSVDIEVFDLAISRQIRNTDDEGAESCALFEYRVCGRGVAGAPVG
jgi:hypothetical protein